MIASGWCVPNMERQVDVLPNGRSELESWQHPERSRALSGVDSLPLLQSSTPLPLVYARRGWLISPLWDYTGCVGRFQTSPLRLSSHVVQVVLISYSHIRRHCVHASIPRELQAACSIPAKALTRTLRRRDPLEHTSPHRFDSQIFSQLALSLHLPRS